MKKQFTIFSAMIFFTLIVVSFFFNNENKAATACGESYTQGGLTYGTVQGSDGKCWLDRNLGATQVATASNDSASYGWLFQWGRDADGHQIRTSQVTSTPSSTDVPGHDFFIHGTGYNADWRDPRNDNLWQGVNGINNPCPAGFRLPTKQEWTTLISSAGITNSVTAFDSVLKLPLGGYRGHVGNYLDEYLYSYYWSSTVDDGSFIHEGRSFYLTIGAPGERGYYNDIGSAGRAGGFSVRCLADSFTATPSCTSWAYSDWSACSTSGLQTRTVISSSPSGCTGGSPTISQSCTYAPLTCGQTVSYGGQSYNTVQIGSQCWFKENLNVGNMIGNLEVPDNTAPTLNNPSTVSKWCFNDSSASCTSEGGLYTWAEANGLANSSNSTPCNVPAPNQGICPAGWHIPTDTEFYTLENYLTTSGQSCDPARADGGCSSAGAKLVYGGTSGFDAIGAGNHETTGATSFFDKRSPTIHFWSSSPCLNCSDWGHSFVRSLFTSDNMVYRGWTRNMQGMSVRCLADSFTATPSCTSWAYSDWSTCSTSGQQTRTVTSSSPSGCSGGNPVLSQSCTYVPPTCSSWAYSNWSACSSSGQQTRTVTSSSPSGCTGGNPVLSQSCTPSTTTCTSWTYSGWGACSSSGQQTRTVTSSSPSNCTGGNPALSQSCNPSTITCTSWSYSSWGNCSASGQQTRTIASSSPSNCTGGSPVTTQSCTYTSQCTADTWECGDWGDCSSNGTKTRSCSKTYDCSSASTASPATSQSCTYVPPCTQDTWECEGWSECSPLGVKTRNCKKTYDCSSVETTPDNYQTCTYTGNNNTKVQHEAIIKSTVQLLCFNDSNGIVGSGSGTIINSSGVILTNKHVIKDRNNKDLEGCFVGLTTNINNYPDFSEVAFILDQSASEDMALLKIYNGSNNYSFTDINSGNSQNLSFSKSILAYGYPVYNMQPKTVGDLIQKITFSSGNYSGDLGSGYFKTTAMLEHGISGGGAYTEEGLFIGITSAALVGEINTMGLILRIDNVKNWINSTGVSSKLTKEVSSLSSTLDFHSANVKNFNATADNSGSNSSEVIKEEKKLITKIDNSLSKRMSGNILLQVEKKGEGWYVNPDNKKKYYLGRPADAFSIMRNLGLGIKHSELASYLNAKFPSKLSGKILLDVEKNGEAYYVNPKDLKGYFLSRPSDAFKVMRDLGLGITNTDIRKIDVGEIK